jgi:triosephosphate isomerase
VSGTDLREAGCTYVEVGHAERSTVFGESVDVAKSKFAAAVRNGLHPVLCIGESEPLDAADAVAECVRQLQGYLERAGQDAAGLDLVVAYEPAWAIGKSQTAPPEYIEAVVTGLRKSLEAECPFRGFSIIYGGSAGEGTLSALDGAVDGLFLGRFAHDIGALEGILDEAERLLGTERR